MTYCEACENGDCSWHDEARLCAREDHEDACEALRHVQRTGRARSDWWRQTLEQGDYIRFGSPIAGVSGHNCYQLTERGNAFLAR